jgi:hypothetical protein
MATAPATPTITYSEALDSIRNLKNQWRALERFEDILSLAAGAERVVAESESRVTAARASADEAPQKRMPSGCI